MENRDPMIDLIKYGVIAVCVIVIASLSSCQASKYQIRKAIEAGASPVEAACAFNYGTVTDQSLCVIELMRGDK